MRVKHLGFNTENKKKHKLWNIEAEVPSAVFQIEIRAGSMLLDEFIYIS